MINVELNSCMGGMARGFQLAGVHFDIAVDYNANACDSYQRNIGHRPVQVDIKQIAALLTSKVAPIDPTLRHLLSRLRSEPIGLFVADPPCTPWSMAGARRGLADDRDLLRETVEIIIALRPEAAIIGNVPGLDKGDNWRNVVVPVIQKPLAEAGYHMDYQSFDAADFGTPQRRHRPFWFFHRADAPCINWPTATHAPPPVLPGCGQLPWVTVGAALEAVFGPRESWGEEVGRSVRLRRRGQNSKQHGSIADKPARTVGTSNLSDGNVLVESKRKRPGKKPRASVLDAPAGVVTSKQNQGAGSVLVYDMHHPPSDIDKPSNVVRASSGGGANRAVRVEDPNRPPAALDEPHRTISRVCDQAIIADESRDAGLLDRPATTIAATRTELTAPGHHDVNVNGSGNSGILLSEKALKVLQGFPSDWHVAGETKRARMSQIGQAMPPQLSRAIGEAYVRWRDSATAAEETRALL